MAVALTIAKFGGIRLRIGGVRLSVTSPWRIIAWAAVIAIARHLIIRHDPIYRRLVGGVRSAVRSAAFGVAWPIFVGTRLPVLLVGYFAVVTIGYSVPEPPNRISTNEFLNLPSRWDAGWYHAIAVSGYAWNPRATSREQQSVVFFPAYPLLMRSFGRLIGSRAMAAGMLISFTAFFVALTYLYRLGRQWLDHERMVTALWLLSAYPFALFFSAAYTESLFLCGAAGAFFHFHRGEFVKAGLWGAMVGLTRPNGCFLSIPLGILALAYLPVRLPHSWGRLIRGEFAPISGQWPVAGGQNTANSGEWPVAGSQNSDNSRNITQADGGLTTDDQPLITAHRPLTTGHRSLTTVLALMAAAMPAVGMLLYSVFVFTLTGDPFAWARGHVAWGREYGGLSNLFVNSYTYIATFGVYQYTASIPLDFLNGAPALFMLGMSWLVFRRFGLPYALFVVMNVIPPMLVGGFLSMGRFTSVLFPTFFALALLVSTRTRPAWIAGFAMGQALTASLFFTWRQLF